MIVFAYIFCWIYILRTGLVKFIQKYVMCILDVAGSEHQVTPQPPEASLLVIKGRGREWRQDRWTVIQGRNSYVVIFNKVVREGELR